MNAPISVTNGVGTLVLDHPPLNLLTRAVLAGLRGGLSDLAGRTDLRVVLFTSAGPHFSAGADVGEHLPPEHRELIPEFLETIAALDDFPLPVVAAVRGRCLGGGFELVQAADMVVAGEEVVFGQPEILLGVSPPSACALLPGLCGRGRAAEIVLTGDPLTADQAREWGLVQRVVPEDRVEEEALRLAGRIARHSAAALRSTKKALRVGSAAGRAETFRRVAEIYVDELMETEDAVEGLRAFLEKRSPAWAHK